jgi:hypothetical protein
MEIFIPIKGEFRDYNNNLLEKIEPITETFEVVDDYYFDATATVTNALTPGTYTWGVRALKGAEVYYVLGGDIKIKANLFTQVAGYDGRSAAKVMLDAIEAVISGTATGGQKSKQIGDRMITSFSPMELEQWRNVYRSEVNNEEAGERIARGLGSGNKIRTRFV